MCACSFDYDFSLKSLSWLILRAFHLNRFWDYLSQNPESIHQVMILFGDRGVPDGYRGMNGYSGHTFKFVNASGTFKYVQVRDSCKNLSSD
jgi:catalase